MINALLKQLHARITKIERAIAGAKAYAARLRKENAALRTQLARVERAGRTMKK